MKPLTISTSKHSLASQQLLNKASTKHEGNPQQTIKLVT